MDGTKNEELKPGTLLISEKPFVYILSSKCRTDRCDFCFASKPELRKCSNCCYVYYCGKVCQKEGWPVHKWECDKLKRIRPRVIPDAARMLARLIKKVEKGGNLIKSYYSPNKFRTFKDLMSHYPDIKRDFRRMEHFATLCHVLEDYFGDESLPNSAELMGLFGRMCVNSFNIADEELCSLGTGIYLAASILDHSCKPNAVAIFQGTLLNIRLTEPVRVLNWNKIFLSYIDTLQESRARQEELRRTYYFLCQCPRCLDLEESKAMNAAACRRSHCDGCVEIKDSDSKCDKCRTPASSDLVREYKEVTEITDGHLGNMKLAYLDVCKVCLKKHRGILHKLNIRHVRILDSAFESSIDFTRWDDALEFGTELIDGYRKYLGKIHPLIGLLYLKLAKISIHKEKLPLARDYLGRACQILKVTHGEGSMLFKREVIPLLRDDFFNS